MFEPSFEKKDIIFLGLIGVLLGLEKLHGPLFIFVAALLIAYGLENALVCLLFRFMWPNLFEV